MFSLVEHVYVGSWVHAGVRAQSLYIIMEKNKRPSLLAPQLTATVSALNVRQLEQKFLRVNSLSREMCNAKRTEKNNN